MNSTAVLADGDRQAIEQIVRGVQTAWNAADGAAFGALMAPDVEFVTIRAEHVQGRDAIAAGRAGIFTTVFAGSTIRYVSSDPFPADYADPRGWISNPNRP